MKEIIKVKSYFFKYYDSEDWILKDINFSLKKSETLLILGPNGCGKTTLVLSLLGIPQRYKICEYKGEILVFNKNILEYNLPSISLKVGIVQQDPESQIVNLYVNDEVAFGLENLNFKKEKIVKKVEESLKVVDLFHKNNYETNELSYGEKQKLMIASLIALDNEIFILDEPTSNLDPLSRKNFFDYIKKFKEKGKTLIIIEHNLDEIIDIIDKVLIINKQGKVDFFGNYDDMLKYLDYDKAIELGLWLPYKLELKLYLEKINKKKINDIEVINYIKNIKIKEEFQENKNLLFYTKNLFFKYNKEEILKNINIKFEERKIYSIIGPNGSGKTTLCKVLSKILNPSKGEIIFKDKFNISFCFQNPDLQFTEKSIEKEIYSFFKYKEGIKEALNLINEFGLKEYLSKNPFVLSQGQKRILSIILSLINNPKVLILDEPTFGLDRKNSKKIMKLIKELKNKNKTILFVTHDIKECLEYADEIIVLNRGEVVFHENLKDFIIKLKEMEKYNIYIPKFMLDYEKEIEKFIYKIRYLRNEIF